jgi:hypothetical protein
MPTGFSTRQVETLRALACGILPSDELDDGVGSLDAGEHLATKLAANPFAERLLEDLRVTERDSAAHFGRSVGELDGEGLSQLLAMLRERTPLLFKFVRMESCALYLSQPATWPRIGFPGPSIELGGYPDFDQPQR